MALVGVQHFPGVSSQTCPSSGSGGEVDASSDRLRPSSDVGSEGWGYARKPSGCVQRWSETGGGTLLRSCNQRRAADASLRHAVGVFLARIGKAEDALAAMKAATRLEPQNAKYQHDLAELRVGRTKLSDHRDVILQRACRGASPCTSTASL